MAWHQQRLILPVRVEREQPDRTGTNRVDGVVEITAGPDQMSWYLRSLVGIDRDLYHLAFHFIDPWAGLGVAEASTSRKRILTIRQITFSPLGFVANERRPAD